MESISTEPLLCIVTTIFNSKLVLPVTLRSLENQTCKRFIHVIYADGKCDDCARMIQEYAQSIRPSRDSFPLVLFSEGEKNIGCDLAHGSCFASLPEDCSHFCWLDAGDILDPAFVEVFYKVFSRHKDCGWFHFKSRHYSFETMQPIGKKSYNSFPKKYLRASEQWPAVAFSQFYYHIIVVDKKRFAQINPTAFIAGPTEHDGVFYDSQIVHSLLCARVKVYYVKKCLCHIMLDPNSVACSFKSKGNDSSLFLGKYLSQLNLETKAIEVLLDYKKLCFSISQWNACIIGNTCDYAFMKATWNRLSLLIDDNHLPPYFFMRKMHYAFLLS